MKRRLLPLILVLLFDRGAAGNAQTAPPSGESEGPTQIETIAPASPGISQAASTAAIPSGETLRVFAGKSLVVDSEQQLQRVSVTDPAIASATIVTPNQVLIHGHLPGSVTLILWDEQERMRSYDLQVELDLDLLRETIHQVLPAEAIEVSQSGASIVVSGTVSSQQVAERAVALAQTYAEGVVNLLEEQSDQILLKVRFAEVDRSGIQELGVDFFTTSLRLGEEYATGAISTRQFQQTLANVGAVPPEVQRGSDPAAPNLVAGGAGNPVEGSPAVYGLSDLLNVFIFHPGRNVGVVIRALEQRNLLQILAEPNLLAQNGREASFLAGGEFPFPIVQGISGGVGAVTIQFREFGVRLNFTPTVLSDDTIALKVVQEVSALDFSNALTVSGFVVPALSTRRAETELQLQDGQSFAIAGLIDNRLTEVISKIPGLGDIPILGKLFQSRALERANTELMVLVTPQRVKPIERGETAPAPEFPKTFLEKDEFDKKEKKKEGTSTPEEPRAPQN